jgi:hypothetical protein
MDGLPCEDGRAKGDVIHQGIASSNQETVFLKVIYTKDG